MKGKLLSLAIILISISSAFSQAYISGPTSCQPGQLYYYEAQFSWLDSYSDIHWTITDGQIVAQNVDPYAGVIYCYVQWMSSSTVYEGYLEVNDYYTGQSGSTLVTVENPLYPGNIWSSNYAFNNSTPVSVFQDPATGGYCGAAYDYSWQYSKDALNWVTWGPGETFPTSSPAWYEKTFIRRLVSCGGYQLSSNVLEFNYRAANWENRNYIRTNELLYAGKKTFIEANEQPIGVKQESTIFYDGLGRPEQRVLRAGSPDSKDLVTPVEYDLLGRETKKHLAYQAGTADGKFKSTALTDQQAFMAAKYPGENSYFAETKLEESPLNRPIKSLAPGLNWGGNNAGIGTGYELNKTVDAVRIWKIDNFSSTALPVSDVSDLYPENTLYKTITTDERGKRIIDYKDKDGMVILRKQQEKTSSPDIDESHKGWLCTYYVYDDFGRLRYMITPKAVKQMEVPNNWVLTQQMAAGLCYKYVYDGRGRLIEKKLPDAGSQYFVYDSRDRLVFSQDGNQKAGRTNANNLPEWTFFVYDAQNRQLASGKMIEDVFYTRQDLQSYVDNPIFNSGIRTITLQTDVSEVVTAYNPVPLFAGATVIEYFQVSVNTINYYDNNQATYSTVTMPYASTFENIDAQSPTQRVIGLMTGTKARVLNGGSTFLKSTTIYDEKGRPLQEVTKNVFNQTLTTTKQYDFAGKLRASVYKETKTSVGYELIMSKYEFDHAGRLKKSIKAFSHKENFLKPVYSTGERVVAEHAYDELGQLKTKTLAPGYNGPNGSFIEKLDYDYNIRGWMTGINKAYVASTSSAGRFFGMELGYDKSGDAGFANTILNGNVAGMAWKTAGDNTARKFDYQYDNANRLVLANFNQKNTPGATNWTKDKFDFSVPVIQYDANGNILRMEQQGVNFAGIVPMDKMSYGYDDYSNKLKWVADDGGAVDYKLGDFTDKNTGSGNIDYLYDENGNLNKDNNKGISSIRYNYLNLPELIDVTGKGSILYIYDAAGNKLQKVVTDNTPATGQVVTTTTYSGPVVYTGGDLYMMFEEGRVRLTKDLFTAAQNGLTIDYFIKDHLGNIRMVLTEQTQTNTYPVATMETASAALEDKYYRISNRTDKPVELQGNSTYDQRYGAKMSKLSSLAGDSRIGPSILLKVMAGDLLQAKTDYYYNDNGTQTNTVSVLNDLVTNLLVHLNAGQAGGTAKAQSGVIGPNVQSNAVTNSLVTQQNTDYVSTKPKAFLNYIVFDEQFNAVSKGVKQVQNNGPLQPTLMLNDIPVSQNGWIYVFVNNESQQAVYFDNFQVVHTRGNILEETHYYPFGLTMKAISPRALSINPANKNKFGDKELQSEEFSDGTSLDEYDFGARYYDPQTGRWNSLDPQADEFPNVTPYSYGGNNPVLFADKDGKFIHLILKYGVNVGINIGIQMITAYMFDPNVKSWSDAWDKASVWDAMWESASDMLGSRALRMAGDGIMGMFHYMDDVGFRNITGGGLLKSGAMGILEPLIYKYIGKYGASAVEKGLKKIGIDQAAINKFLGRKSSTPKVDLKAGKTFIMSSDGKKFGKNYRENLKTLTGHDPGTGATGASAHHIFPQAERFQKYFDKAGIDINDPINMQWWHNSNHFKESRNYNLAWDEFFLGNPNATKTQIMDFGKNLMGGYGMSVYF